MPRLQEAEQKQDDAQLRGCVAGLASILEENDLRVDPHAGALATPKSFAPDRQIRRSSCCAVLISHFKRPEILA